MWCNQIFSLIKPTEIQIDIETIESKYIVENVIVCDNYEIANQIAKLHYGDDSYAIDTTQLPVNIGFEYKNGLFYNLDGDVIDVISTAEQKQIEDLTIAVADLIGGAY